MREVTPQSALEFPLHNATDNLLRLEKALDKLNVSLDRYGIRTLVESIYTDVVKANRQMQAALWQLEQLQHIINSSASITSSLQLDQVLELVLDSVIELTGAERVHLMLHDRDKERLVIRISRNWDNQTPSEVDAEFSTSIINAALEKGEPIVSLDARTDRRFNAADSVVMQGLRAVVCIPLLLDEKVVGALYADDRMRQALFAPEMIPILSTFGTQAAIAIEKARLHEEEIQKQRIEEELNVGKRIQLSLLPKSCPVIAGWDFAADYRAARVVSGDFYDFFQLSDQRLGIVIADVADKGIPAAILMAVSRTTIRATALSGRQPAEALSRASQLMLQDSQADMFLTAFYAVIDPANGQLVYANGGHNHPLLLRSTERTVEELSAPGIVLGMLPDVQLENCDALMGDGDVVVFYTDGVTEAMNSHQQEYGEQRLRDTLLANGHLNAGGILDAILNSVSEFTGNAAQSDDLTVVVVKRMAG